MNILWDFDGTLFDTYPALVKAFIQLSQQPLDSREVLTWLKKDSKTAFKHYGIPEERRAKYQELYNQYSLLSSEPFPFLEDALAFVDHNIIVTHRDRESTMLLLEKFNLKKYFAEIVSVEEDGYTRKPHSSSYEYVHNKYKLHMAIGDRELDLVPARSLKIKTAAFQNSNILADYHLASYMDFKTVILDSFFREK
ncbi:HAD hydrolase-like protein [Bacillota bacterium Lsc_1132]